MKKPIVPKKERLFDIITARNRILRLLFLYPYTEFTLSELAEQGSVSKSTTSRVLNDLKNEELITIVDLGIVWRIRANFDNPNYKNEKIIYNLSIIFRSGIIDYLNQNYHPKNIIVFGSFRRGEDSPESDIDIAMETDEEIDLKILSIEDFKEIESQIERRIRIYLFNGKKIDLNLFNNIANGIVLSGFLEVKR